MGLSATTKPSCILIVGSSMCFVLGNELGGWYWLFTLAFALAVIVDACRIATHEQENGCG